MTVLRYTLLHIHRRPLAFCCMLLAAMLLGCLLLGVDISMQVRQAGLDAMVDESEVWCIVGRIDGSTRWAANAHHVAQLLHPSDPSFAVFVNTYVTDVRARVTLPVQPARHLTEVDAFFLTHWEADDALLLLDERVLTLTPGYGTSIFTGDEAVCIAGSRIAPLDSLLTLTLPENCGGTEITVRVVGSIAGGDGLYLPWALYESSVPNLHAATPADSLSFRLKDNRMIDQFQQDAAIFYAPPGTNADSSPDHDYTLTIRDTQFRENLSTATRNLQSMRLMTPAFLAGALGTSLLLATILLRTRRTEYAILRSMGQAASFILLHSITETLLAVIPGIGLALLIMQSSHSLRLLPLLAAFLLGSLLPVLRYITQPILNQVKGEQ